MSKGSMEESDVLTGGGLVVCVRHSAVLGHQIVLFSRNVYSQWFCCIRSSWTIGTSWTGWTKRSEGGHGDQRYGYKWFFCFGRLGFGVGFWYSQLMEHYFLDWVCFGIPGKHKLDFGYILCTEGRNWTKLIPGKPMVDFVFIIEVFCIEFYRFYCSSALQLCLFAVLSFQRGMLVFGHRQNWVFCQ